MKFKYISITADNDNFTNRIGNKLAIELKKLGVDAKYKDQSKLSSSTSSLLSKTSDYSDYYTESILWMLDRRTKVQNQPKSDVFINNRSLSSESIKIGKKIKHSENRLGLYTWLDQMNSSVFNIKPADIVFIIGDNTNHLLKQYSELFSKDTKFIENTTDDKIIDQMLDYLNVKKSEIKQKTTVNNSSSKLSQLSLLNSIGSESLFVEISKPTTNKDRKGNYNYFTPKNLDADSAKNYENIINKIFDQKHKLEVYKTKIDLNLLLPMAAYSLVEQVSNELSAVAKIRSSALPELQQLAPQLNFDQKPTLSKRLHEPIVSYGASTAKSIKQIAEESLPQLLSAENEEIELVSYDPKSEMDLIPYMLFEHSNIALSDIKREVEDWDYKKKSNSIKAYFGQRSIRDQMPAQALSQATYQWELITDFIEFKKIEGMFNTSEITWQELTPRYGYEVGEEIEKLGISDEYEECFDLSYQLYSTLQKAGFQTEAQYATLMGHKLRWSIKLNGIQLLRLLENRMVSKDLRLSMLEKLEEAHPIFASQILLKKKGNSK